MVMRLGSAFRVALNCHATLDVDRFVDRFVVLEGQPHVMDAFADVALERSHAHHLAVNFSMGCCRNRVNLQSPGHCRRQRSSGRRGSTLMPPRHDAQHHHGKQGDPRHRSFAIRRAGRRLPRCCLPLAALRWSPAFAGKGIDDFVDGLRTIAGADLHRPGEDGSGALRDVGVEITHRHGHLHAGGDIHRVGGAHPTGQCVQGGAQRVDVAAHIRAPGVLLRRREAWRDGAFRDGTRDVVRRLHDLRDAEIDELESSVFAQHDVGRLQILEDHRWLVTVQVAQHRTQLACPVQHGGFRGALLLAGEMFVEWNPSHQLHHDVAIVVLL